MDYLLIQASCFIPSHAFCKVGIAVKYMLDYLVEISEHSVEIFVTNVPVSVYGDGSGVSHRYEPGIRMSMDLESVQVNIHVSVRENLVLRR
jgi:hypothetical protein